MCRQLLYTRFEAVFDHSVNDRVMTTAISLIGHVAIYLGVSNPLSSVLHLAANQYYYLLQLLTCAASSDAKSNNNLSSSNRLNVNNRRTSSSFSSWAAAAATS